MWITKYMSELEGEKTVNFFYLKCYFQNFFDVFIFTEIYNGKNLSLKNMGIF